jgi:ribulose-phosphate 3-epimerase
MIEVDGNVSFENAEKMRRAGADIFVAGSSSVFAKGGSIEENTAKLREAFSRGEKN